MDAVAPYSKGAHYAVSSFLIWIKLPHFSILNMAHGTCFYPLVDQTYSKLAYKVDYNFYKGHNIEKCRGRSLENQTPPILGPFLIYKGSAHSAERYWVFRVNNFFEMIPQRHRKQGLS